MFKHVLNTRLTPAPSRNWSGRYAPFRPWHEHLICRPAGRVTRMRPRPLAEPIDAIEGAAAIEDLYRTRRRSLIRQVRRTPASDPEDVVQTLFARILRRVVGSDQPIESPDAYLRRSAGNLVREEVRVARSRSTALHVSLEDVPLSAADPVSALEARDMLCRLEVALTKLKPKTREIFLAHRLDGYSYAEISARTGLSIKAVEKQMSLAIAQLDRLLPR